jgi:hypothetical protein
VVRRASLRRLQGWRMVQVRVQEAFDGSSLVLSDVQCALRRRLALNSRVFYQFFDKVEVSNFEVASDSFSTFKVQWSLTAPITEINRIHLVLFGMQNRTFCPYLAAIDRILVSVMPCNLSCARHVRVRLSTIASVGTYASSAGPVDTPQGRGFSVPHPGL